jgi:hypothetical protein
MRRLFALTILAVVGAAAPAAAQSGGRTVGVRAFGHYEMVSMAASRTFDAVIGTSSMSGVGGGAEAIGIWKGLFVRGAVSQMKDTGQRAFVFGSDIIRVDVPLDVKIRTVELGAGWRVPLGASERFAVYGGGGVLFLKYDETSTQAAGSENVNESFNGIVAFGGAEVTIWKWIVAGVEGQYRSVPDAIGSAGISQLVDETDLGGTAIRVLFGVKF